MQYDKVDPVSGRRYREFGNSREYEPDYRYSYGMKSGLRENNAQKEEKRCPFRSMINDRCSREQCAFFAQSKESCALAIWGSDPVCDTAGAKCPINRERRVCDNKCALYKNGCMIAARFSKERI